MHGFESPLPEWMYLHLNGRKNLTAAGRRAYTQALPYWERVQSEFTRALGAENWNRLMELSVRTAGN